jgi:hypothetical protein
MERLTHYRQLIQDILLPMEKWKHEPRTVRLVAVFDEKRDRYLLARTGWMNGEDVYSLLIHVEIEDGKVIVYQDNTEEEIYEQLLEGGVADQELVQAWLSHQEH